MTVRTAMGQKRYEAWRRTKSIVDAFRYNRQVPLGTGVAADVLAKIERHQRMLRARRAEAAEVVVAA